VPKILCFDDNVEILRNEIASEAVDLVFGDPPFDFLIIRSKPC
jgi:hypothetical protein